MTLITGGERRRRWSSEDRTQIVAAIEEQGAVVAEVARRIGMLNGFDGSNPLFRSYVAETLQALSQLGSKIGRNVQFIERWSGSDADRTAMAQELVAVPAKAIGLDVPVDMISLADKVE
jgi:hypothetical protein